MSTISPGNALPHVSDHAPRHARSSLKKLRVPARHALTPVTHRPLTHTKHAPQSRVRHMRHATITKQRIRENSSLIIATTRHVASGSRYALTRSPHPIHKLTKKRPRAPLRPGTAHAIAHHQTKALPAPTRTPQAATNTAAASNVRAPHKRVTNYTRKQFDTPVASATRFLRTRLT